MGRGLRSLVTVAHSGGMAMAGYAIGLRYACDELRIFFLGPLLTWECRHCHQIKRNTPTTAAGGEEQQRGAAAAGPAFAGQAGAGAL